MSGVTNARTQDGFTTDRALARLRAWVDGDDDRDAVLSHGSDGSDRIVVTVSGRGTYDVNVDPDGWRVTLVAYSPCISLAPGESVFDEY